MRAQEILDQSQGGLEIYAHVFKRLTGSNPINKLPKSGLKNPLYDDSNGSLSIYQFQGKVHHRDFGNEAYAGDAFSFFAAYAAMDIKSQFTEVCRLIAKELGLHLSGVAKRKSTFSKLGKEGSRCSDQSRPDGTSESTPEFIYGNDFSYFEGLFPWKKDVASKAEEFGLLHIASCILSNMKLKSSIGDPMYAWTIGGALKFYWPLRKEFRHQWHNHELADYSFYSELWNDDDVVLITEGYKDAFSGFLFGFNTLPLDQARSAIPPRLLQLLKARNKRPILCLDNDKAGVEGAYALSQKTGFPTLQIPQTRKGQKIKDLTDLLGTEDGMQELQQLVAKLSKFEYQSPDPHLRSIEETRKLILEQAAKTISWTEPILKLHETGILYPNSILMISGAAGTHKVDSAKQLLPRFWIPHMERTQVFRDLKRVSQLMCSTLIPKETFENNSPMPFSKCGSSSLGITCNLLMAYM